jgi:hypothetical protein
MAGLMTVALAGSAQAAGNTMFAVQDSTPTDKFTVSDTGDVASKGNMSLDGKFAGGLQNVPVPSGLGYTAPTTGAGAFHYATTGPTTVDSAFMIQHAVTPVGGVYNQQSAGNFTFYRINKSAANPPVYSLPNGGSYLGYVNFGTIDPVGDPNGAPRYVTAQFIAKAEAGGTANPAAWTTVTNTPTYLSFWTTHNTAGVNTLSEKMRLTSDGKLGIGVAGVPTSKLQVVGLPVCPDNATAKAAAPGGCGIGVGGFYVQGPVGGTTTTGAVFVAF